MCMCLIYINDLPKTGENNCDYFMEGLTTWQNRTQQCKMTSTHQKKEISIRKIAEESH